VTDRGLSPEAHDPDELSRVARILSWVFLIGFLFVSGTARAVYSSHGTTPSARFEVLTNLSFLILLWYWFREQCRPYRVSLPLDMGFFVASLWFILLPYYLWRHERWRGGLKFLGLVIAFALAQLFTVMLHHILVWMNG
jgi:hypothetical protein